MGVIRTAHIEQLADFTEGRDKLGELVRRLIWAWLPNRVLGIHFLSGETNNYPGWDGWLRLALGNGLPHNSLWELSVRRDAAEKIWSDFKTAAERALPPGWTRNSATYVAVTARSLANKEKLQEELRSSALNKWADVQIVDGKSLEQWIEKSPAVEQWASELFSVTGVVARTSLTRFWSTWSEVTKPQIAPRLMTTGRDTSDLARALNFENDRIVSVQADSPEEVVGVVYALIDQLPENERDKLLFNATVLGSEETAERLAEQPLREDEEDPLTILVPPATSQAQRLHRKGHKVVLALGRNTPSLSQISLRRSLRSDFEKALNEHMAVPLPEASADARACGASVSIWRVWHLLRDGAAARVPLWARDAARKTVIPAVFARAWDESITLDQDILSMLAARPYTSYQDEIHEFAACDDPLHERAGSVHKVIAPSVAYALVRDAITNSHVEDLVQAMKKVFSAIDADVMDWWETLEVDLPQEQKTTYSSWLKDGLAETLLAIAFLPQPRTGVFQRYGGGEGLANTLVRELPGLAGDPRLLASLRDQLPLLAEAAPVPFVEALERLLQGGPDIAPLFRDRGLFGAAHHAGLLWALELLAWSPTLLLRVTKILLELSGRVDTGRSGNTPMESLREIYLAWIRGTSVPGEQRAAILRSFAESHPDALWRLLLSLLPKDHDSSSGTHQPAWRDFGRSELPPLTRREVSRTYRVYAELALDLAEPSLKRQLDLLDFYVHFADEYRARLLAMLESGGEHGDTPEAWERLRHFISRNRSFAKASWAVDVKSLDRMQAIAEKLTPLSASAKSRWLFDDASPELGERAADYEKRDEVLSKLRLEAVEAVLSMEGVKELDALVRNVKFPHILGATVARLRRSTAWLAERLDSWAKGGSPSELAALQAASGIRNRSESDAWTSVLKETVQKNSWAPVAVAHALLDYPPTGATFKLVEDAGKEVSDVYWRNCWLHSDCMDDTARDVAPRKLVEHGRAMHVLDLVCHRYKNFGSQVVLRAAQAAVNELLNSNQPIGSMDSYHLQEALNWLRKQPDVPRIDIARIEYPLIPLLASVGTEEEGALVLHAMLSEDPSFFVQVLSDAFRPRSDADSGADSQIDESVRARARAAWNLLRSWKDIPGEGADGEIDYAALRTWIQAALLAAEDADRLEVALIKIGEVLYHAKPDPITGDWPPVSILKTLEELASDELERGFCLEVVNSRGVTMRRPLDGGSLERKLQEEWEGRAISLASQWKRSKAMFHRIGEDWGRQAVWHDQDSEQTRMRWS